MSQLTISHLCLGYEGREIVHDLNFAVNAGDYVCIVGENGSGKSTLMKTILGLTAPIHGEVIFGDGLKKGGIGYLPQQSDVQRDFPATVKEIVLSGFQGSMGLLPFYTRKMKEKALENMKKLQIEDLKDRCYRELSGGQQQRVLLSRALCATSSILFLDEPVSGLDEKRTEEMYEMIRKLNKEGTTILMISHDMEASLTYASHILRLPGLGAMDQAAPVSEAAADLGVGTLVGAGAGNSQGAGGIFYGTKEEYEKVYRQEEALKERSERAGRVGKEPEKAEPEKQYYDASYKAQPAPEQGIKTGAETGDSRASSDEPMPDTSPAETSENKPSDTANSFLGMTGNLTHRPRKKGER